MKIFNLTIVFLLISVFGYTQSNSEITISELEEHVYFLASDSLKGRKPGTAESKVAADYIRLQFEEFG